MTDPRQRLLSVERFFSSRINSTKEMNSILYDDGKDGKWATSNEDCYSKGADQGIHNWVLHGGDVNFFLGEKPTVFRQGEGPINTLGVS